MSKEDNKPTSSNNDNPVDSWINVDVSTDPVNGDGTPKETSVHPEDNLSPQRSLDEKGNEGFSLAAPYSIAPMQPSDYQQQPGNAPGTNDYLEESTEDPELNRNQIINNVIDTINLVYPSEILQSPTKKQRAEITQKITNEVITQIRRMAISSTKEYEDDLVGELGRRLMGLGFLDLLLPGEDGTGRNDLSEITIYSSGLVQVMKKGSVRWDTIEIHPSPGEIDRVINHLLGDQNKVLNEVNPSVNAKLPRTKANPGGGRIKVIHKSIVPPGVNHALNVRLYEQKPVQPEWLLERKLMSAEMMETLQRAMQTGKRILITGGTRTGKTTLLSALCNYLPEGWRVIKIEDPEEIWIDSLTVQAIEARPQALGTEVKPYTLADGVDDAMRMSPDYLIIGEVRDGKAAMALFRALMTGHSGACTFHADNEREAAARMSTIMGADVGIKRIDANQMFADAIDLLVQIVIQHDSRRISTISHVNTDLKGGEVSFSPIWKFDVNSNKESPKWEKVGEE